MSKYEKDNIILSTIDLCKTYGKGENKVDALRDINLYFQKGKFTSIIGPSGSGKSTLLHCIAGLDSLTSGKVIIGDKDISNLKDDEMSRFRSEKFGFIFQNFNLIPVVSVYNNIILPIKISNKKIDKIYINNIIKLLGLTDKVNKLPNELSGGQQQRVAIARALANKPDIIFADEPTGNLDSENTDEVIKLLKTCVMEFNQTLIMITHNDDIAKMADECIKIQDGVVVS